MKKVVLVALALMALTACSSKKEISYLDKSLPPEVRAADLLSKLSLEEKAALVQFSSPALEQLGIKRYNWWSEALHGVARNGSATVFPQPIGMASSFDREKIETVLRRFPTRPASRTAWQPRKEKSNSIRDLLSGRPISTFSVIRAGAAAWKPMGRTRI